MHFEILVEDQSGKKALDILVPKILCTRDMHTFTIRSYKGIGKIPKDLTSHGDPSKRILLDQLPKIIKGLGRSWRHYPATLIVVCDLDNRDFVSFMEELTHLLHSCTPRPETRFCIAVEEGEAWLLGDIEAVKAAYPRAKDSVLRSYRNDSICGTWEKLADAVYKGGHSELLKKGWQEIGSEKSRWALNISPYIHVENNLSPSFQFFRETLRELA